MLIPYLVSTETGVTDMENGALLTCGVHCKPFNKGNPGRIMIFH